MSRAAKVAAVALLALLSLALALVSALAPPAPRAPAPQTPGACAPPAAEPLRRCRTVTQPDPACAAAWDAQRRRFFRQEKDER